MPKKSEVIVANPRTVRGFEFTEGDSIAAVGLGIVLGGSVSDRVSRAAVACNMAARLAVEAGYLLLSVKAEMPHGEFEDGMEALGLTSQRASELMRMAKFATMLPESQRNEMLMLPKSKVLVFASADPEVIEDVLEGGDFADLADMNTRALRLRIRELEAQRVNLSVERDTVASERDGLAKQLKRQRAQRDDDGGVPVVVADLRAEASALVKRVEMCFSSLQPVGVELANLAGNGDALEWVNPTGRMVVSGMVALRLQLDGLIERYMEAFHVDVKALTDMPDPLAFLDQSEIAQVASEWAQLTALHKHEEALRAYERDQKKPRGKGRPQSAPVAPEVK
jgi:hypothetical protein